MLSGPPPVPPSAKHFAGRWYMPCPGNVAAGAVLANGSIRLLPFYQGERITISDLGCRITTLAASGNIQLAIYNSVVTTGQPGTLVCSTGSISTTSAANVSADITGADVQLAPGLYYMAVNADATAGATVVCQTQLSNTIHTGFLIGATTQNDISPAATSATLGYSFATAFNSWPDLTGQTMVAISTAGTCLVQYKVSSVP